MKMGIQAISIILLVMTLSLIQCQLNSVQPNIIPCYNESAIPGITLAINRPPANLNILVEVIRRLEDANPTKSPREIALLIMQRLRQDGIKNTHKNVDLRYGIPYVPKRAEAYLTTLIMQSFLPNPEMELYYGNLDIYDVCSLHYMISNTIDTSVREDEGRTCLKSARYTLRVRRNVNNNNNGINSTQSKSKGKDVEAVEGVESLGGGNFGTRTVSDSNTPSSQCPIELGVVYTNYGAIKAGLVLAGIATGLNDESVQGCDNRYAATLAGQLSELALTQDSPQIRVGVSGGWNNTIIPKYFFLERSQYTQFTDPEIRGSLDGLYMAMKMKEWTGKFSDLKVSQIIDMYYSPYQMGVFSSDFTACNRKKLYNDITNTANLQKEVECLMPILDKHANYGSTLSADSFNEFRKSAIDSFNNYLPRMSDNDVTCRNDNIMIERAATDLMIFVDNTWSYEFLHPVLSAILDNIDVGRFGSRYTIYLGRDGANITTTRTEFLLDFHKMYNYTTHEKGNRGFDYSKAYQIVEEQVKSKMNNNSYVGGESTVILLMPKKTPDDNERNFLNQRKEMFQRFQPDVFLLVLGAGSSSDYESVLQNPSKDFLQFRESNNENDQKNLARETVERIKNVPRALINPNCAADFKGPSSRFQLVTYVEAGGVNYYRISPNYFYTGDGDNRVLKVTENSYGTIEVCLSRDQPKPNNQTTGSECQTIRSAVKTYDLSGYCSGSLNDCAPIYLSISGKTADGSKCREYFCRYPNNIKHTISMENVGCASGAFKIAANFFSVLVLLLIYKF